MKKNKEKQIKKISDRMIEIENILTDEQEEFLILLDEFVGLYDELREFHKETEKTTNDDTRDIAIRCVDTMFDHNLLDSKYYDQDDEFIIQDIIHNEINKALNIEGE